MQVQAPIDYTRVDPVPYKKTLALVNNFVLNTTQFLNRFSYLCEQKLMQVSRDVQRLEITMNILEAKLGSISGLESITAESVGSGESASVGGGEGPVAPPSSDGPPPPPLPGSSSSSGPPPPPAPAAATQDHTELEDEEPADPSGGTTYKNDPRYSRYFKMLLLRVPAAAIRQKMMMDGVDPDILDKGNQESGWVGDGSEQDGPAPAQADPLLDEEGDDDEDDFFDDE